MGQEQPTPDSNEQPDLDRTQPSPKRPARRLDWRPPELQADGEDLEPQPPPVRRVSRSRPPRRRPPTEGAPAWVVGLGVGALIAVIILLVVVFVFSRPSAKPEPSPTVVVVTPTATLVPRPTATPPTAETSTPEAEPTEASSAGAPPSDAIDVGGYVRVAAPAGLSFRQTAGTNGALIQYLDVDTILEVIGGPEDVDDYTWWQLRTLEDGKEGWSAVGSGEDVFLEPAPAP